MTQQKRRHLTCLISGLMGVLFFASTMGKAGYLSPSNTDWLFSADWLKHYLAWSSFRNGPWSFPLTRIENFVYPLGSSVMETDALPLLAIPIKAFSSWIGQPFQFFGIWFLICYVLQGSIAAILLLELGLSMSQAVLGSAFFIASPTLFFRTGHVALCSHFLILSAFYLYVRAKRTGAFPWKRWALLFALGASIQAYILGMVLPIAIVSALSLRRFFDLAKSGAVLALVGIPLGYFHISSMGAPFFSGYQADLLTLFNSFDVSSWFSRIRDPWGGYEGFAYLGLSGTLLLLGWALTFYKHHFWIERPYRPLFIVCVLMFVFALSGRVTFGGNTILILDWFYNALEPFPSTFRSSGRFVWPLFYGIWIFLLVFVARKLSYRNSMTVMAVVLAIHFAELSNWFFKSHIPVGPSAIRQLSQSFELDPNRIGKVLLVPDIDNHDGRCDAAYRHSDYERALLLFAAENGKPMNAGYPARIDFKKWDASCEKMREALLQKQFEKDTLYALPEKLLSNYPFPPSSCVKKNTVALCQPS